MNTTQTNKSAAREEMKRAVESLRKLASAAARIVEDDNKPTLEHMRELDRQRAGASRIIGCLEKILAREEPRP